MHMERHTPTSGGYLWLAVVPRVFQPVRGCDHGLSLELGWGVGMNPSWEKNLVLGSWLVLWSGLGGTRGDEG